MNANYRQRLRIVLAIMADESPGLMQMENGYEFEELFEQRHGHLSRGTISRQECLQLEDLHDEIGKILNLPNALSLLTDQQFRTAAEWASVRKAAARALAILSAPKTN